MRFLAVVSTVLAIGADAATRVAVIELGKSGTVRRTSAASSETSADAVASFWSALHGYGRKLQYPGMTVVPDLFQRPHDGVVIGLTGVDLDSMPTVNTLMTRQDEDEGHGVVGYLDLPDAQANAMFKHLQVVQTVDPSSLVDTAERHAQEAGFSGIQMPVHTETAADVDAKVGMLMERIQSYAQQSGKTIVLHLIVEEDEASARRRLLSRRLQNNNNNNNGDNANNNGNNNNANDNGNNNNNNNANGNNNANYNANNANGNNYNANNANGNSYQQQYSSYFGYGYYNAYGEWVSGVGSPPDPTLQSAWVLTLGLDWFSFTPGNSLQDHVPNSIFQCSFVDFSSFGRSSGIHYLLNDWYALDGGHLVVWRDGKIRRGRLIKT